ncbi:hypothetical protein [Pseudomonas sp. 18173]|uniref:hypothetical protein n=1 Tax=Pseudomonas sp. 18173 TaxID=3390055 RepID=UPI003D254175
MQIRHLLFAIVTLIFSTLSAAESSDLVGRYYLQGAMEMASELHLKKDGTFVGGIVYGAAEGYAKRIWRVNGDAMLLQSDAGNASRIAGDISFRLQNELGLEELEEHRDYDSERGYVLARNNYVLEIKHDQYTTPAAINPVDVFLEFSDGSAANLVWKSEYDWRLSLPFDERRALKKIGFRDKGSSDAIKWFEVSNTARWLGIDWKKKPGRKISFDQPYERDLAGG